MNEMNWMPKWGGHSFYLDSYASDSSPALPSCIFIRIKFIQMRVYKKIWSYQLVNILWPNSFHIMATWKYTAFHSKVHITEFSSFGEMDEMPFLRNEYLCFQLTEQGIFSPKNIG